MVRLKGCSSNNVSSKLLITIPKGTIKSFSGNMQTQIVDVLQFLMVQLKNGNGS